MRKFLTTKNIIAAIWIIFLIFCVGYVITHREVFTAQAIAEFLTQFKTSIFVTYFVVSILRGLTLVPSTPLVLAGTILFPSDPFLVLAISISGIIFSSTMIYFFSDYLGFGSYLERKHSHKIVKIKDQLQKPTGTFFVFFWSFFPFVPTDAICYVAGILRMNFGKFIVALALGELLTCSIYIFFYTYIASFFQTFN
jgi:uncharacterized membrane protein YdjX (TVP38/TMEM64 family)